jgi:hypothetical protein
LLLSSRHLTCTPATRVKTSVTAPASLYNSHPDNPSKGASAPYQMYSLTQPDTISDSEMPSLTGEALFDLSPIDKQNLKDIHELLERLFVRNRNQHRNQHWFKSLHQFRKQLGLLLEEMESKKKASAAKTMTERLQFWDDKCVHQWYL